MEEIEVTARFSPQGKIIPVSFVWQGRTYKIDSIGRNWRTENGYHALVMDFQNQVHHLLFKAEITSWFLIRGIDTSNQNWA
jgi:hypothetical protein